MSTWTMKNLLFIHEYVGESVSTWLEIHIHINISSKHGVSPSREIRLRGLTHTIHAQPFACSRNVRSAASHR